MATYLSHFPKPVLEDLVKGRWLPIIGAGMSLNARVPPGKKLPLWGDLGHLFEGELEDFASNGPIDAISAFEHEYGRARLIERLSDLLLLREAQPGDAHVAFCAIPFDIVCTTNFDFLLERQYDITPRYVYPVVDEEQLSLNVTSMGTLLLKLHGDVRHPNRLIVTEADYDGFLSKFPLMATYLSNLLITKTAILIGYSLDDPDFRQIWHVVTERLGRTRRTAYTIAVGAKQSDISRFERRGVKVINLPGTRERFGEILTATFRELRDYMLENVLSVSRVTEERPLQELLLPRGLSTRLCFFSLPIELLPFYRELVFPAVKEAGFVPVTAYDVVSPGDSISAKIDALIDRAAVIVVELKSAWTLSELSLAIRKKKSAEARPNAKKTQIIIVASDIHQVPSEAAEFPILLRQEAWVSDPEGFVTDLIGKLDALERQPEEKSAEEAQRLIKMREYRAAVIAAMTYFEAALVEKLGKVTAKESKRLLSVRALADIAVKNGLLPQSALGDIEKWTRIRNNAVHSTTSVSKNDAREIVDGVLKFLNRHNL